MMENNFRLQFKAQRQKYKGVIPVQDFPAYINMNGSKDMIVEALVRNNFEEVSSKGGLDEIMSKLVSVDDNYLMEGSFCTGDCTSSSNQWIRIHARGSEYVWFIRTGGNFNDTSFDRELAITLADTEEYYDRRKIYPDYNSIVQAIMSDNND